MAFTKTNITLDNTMMGPHSINTMMGPYSIDTISGGVSTIPVTITNSTTGTITGSMWDHGTMMSISQQQNSGVVELHGENADIRVNGESMMQTLRNIQDRLNMLRPNPELEAEWDQLRAVGEQYRKLESEFKEKSKMWNTLKK